MGNATLNISSQALAYCDVQQTNNPQRRPIDWSPSIQGIAVRNAKTEQFTIDPLGSWTPFNGQRTTSINSATEFLLSASTMAAATNRYRFAWDAVGANPALRTDRGLTLSGHTITITVNNPNATIQFASSSAGDFAAVVVGDVVLVLGSSTGDTAGPFDAANEGEWQVLGKDGGNQVLTLARPTGVSFSAFGQAVVVTSNPQVLAYSATGVLVGDKVTIGAGFPTAVLTTFDVVHVRPTLFEVLATQPLPVNQTGVPTSTGMVFYQQGKKWVRLEVDQECIVRANGDSGSTQRMTPWGAGDITQAAEYTKTGVMWSLTVVNLTNNPLNVVLLSVE